MSPPVSVMIDMLIHADERSRHVIHDPYIYVHIQLHFVGCLSMDGLPQGCGNHDPKSRLKGGIFLYHRDIHK